MYIYTRLTGILLIFWKKLMGNRGSKFGRNNRNNNNNKFLKSNYGMSSPNGSNSMSPNNSFRNNSDNMSDPYSSHNNNNMFPGMDTEYCRTAIPKTTPQKGSRK